MRLKSDGILFFSIPENKGISKLMSMGNKSYENFETIDDFTIEYILKI